MRMLKAPSNDPSLVLHRPSVDRPSGGRKASKRALADTFALERSSVRPRNWQLPPNPTQACAGRGFRHWGFEWLRRVAFMAAAVIVGLCIASPSAWATSLLPGATVEPDHAGEEQTFQRSHALRDEASYTAIDLKAIEFDPDDDDPFCESANVSLLALRCAPVARQPGHALDFGRSIDTSRFAAGACLPRGPPA